MDRTTFGERVHQHSWPGIGSLIYASETSIRGGHSITLKGMEDLDLVLIGLKGHLHSASDASPILFPCSMYAMGRSSADQRVSLRNFGSDTCKFLQLWLLPWQSNSEANGLTTGNVASREISLEMKTCDPDHPHTCVLSIRFLSTQSDEIIQISAKDICYLESGSVEFQGKQLRRGELFHGKNGQLTTKQFSNLMIVSKPNCRAIVLGKVHLPSHDRPQ